MPKGFDSCKEGGGRIRTKRLPDNKYIHICYTGGKAGHGGKSYASYVHKKKSQ